MAETTAPLQVTAAMARQISFIADDLPSAAARIKEVNVKRLNVAGYDIDNGYPQRMKRLIKASPTAKMVTNKFADYIFGQGFSVSDGKTKTGKDREDGLWNTVLNRKGQTGDDLLSMCALDCSQFETAYFHLNYNALFQGIEVNFVPLETLRYGILERDGQVGLFNNWWNINRYGSNIREESITWIDLFDPNPGAIKSQVKRAGGWQNYKGQIYRIGKGFDRYPEMILDAAINDIEAEILSKITAKANIKNNFGDKVIYQTLPFADDFERATFKADMQMFVGPEGKQLMISEVADPAAADKIISIPNNLDDKRFSYTVEAGRATQYRLANQSAILHSDLNQGRYNQNQLPEAIKAYNNHTERTRIYIQRGFTEILQVMGYDFDCAITPINDITSASQNTDGANSDTNIPADGADTTINTEI